MSNQETIKNTIEELLNNMGVVFSEISVIELEENRTKFVIRTKESGLLIGSKGENFQALDHLIKRVVYKTTYSVKFSLDINDYREEKLKSIKMKALELAEEVKSSKESREMEPMSSYERMIIHSLFQDDPYVETESVSKDGGRRVVLKYISI